jgi:hypothetical protein
MDAQPPLGIAAVPGAGKEAVPSLPMDAQSPLGIAAVLGRPEDGGGGGIDSGRPPSLDASLARWAPVRIAHLRSPWLAPNRTGVRIHLHNFCHHKGGKMAEGVGFEPTGPFGPAVFKTAAINHSTTPPESRFSTRWRKTGTESYYGSGDGSNGTRTRRHSPEIKPGNRVGRPGRKRGRGS